jgi:hypothetical protein
MGCVVRNYFSKNRKVDFALLINEQDFFVLLDGLSGKQSKATASLYQRLGKLI